MPCDEHTLYFTMGGSLVAAPLAHPANRSVVASGFGELVAVATANDGSMLVADYAAGAVFAVDPRGVDRVRRVNSHAGPRGVCTAKARSVPSTVPRPTPAGTAARTWTSRKGGGRALQG